MRVFVDTFRLPKEGNYLDEWEDAFSPVLNDEQEGDRFRFAIADGASSGMLSGEWAGILTETFCDSDVSVADVHGFLERALTQWETWIQEYLRAREEHNRPIKWYEERGLRVGAFATLLGLELNGDMTSGKWQALAVGDSCLFQMRQDQLIASFPVQHSTEFNNNPALICSISAHNDGLGEKTAWSAGEWQVEDEFYLMTDALAQWFLGALEIGQQPWGVLRDLNTSDQEQPFEVLVVKMRMDHVIRNDDVTLVRITIV